MIPVTDEQVAAFERLESARLRLANLQEISRALMSLRERAAWELAHDLAIIEASKARLAWDRLVEQAAREHRTGVAP